MAAYFYLILTLCALTAAAPPVPQFYQQHTNEQLQQINPLDYYLDNPEAATYYNQAQQKRGQIEGQHNDQSSRLESSDPNSEVELISGAQQPQQPPQQTPVAPNLPGLAPGQRVFIVHMPVPGYRPGTIGGYQPVYIVAAAPQGNQGYPGNGYLFHQDPSVQPISPVLGYSRGAIGPQLYNPGLFLGSPLNLGYQQQLNQDQSQGLGGRAPISEAPLGSQGLYGHLHSDGRIILNSQPLENQAAYNSARIASGPSQLGVHNLPGKGLEVSQLQGQGFGVRGPIGPSALGGQGQSLSLLEPENSSSTGNDSANEQKLSQSVDNTKSKESTEKPRRNARAVLRPALSNSTK